jgi:glycosyltransferase involved in cell wall biosynthesis
VKLAGNKNANRIDKVINFLSRRIIVVSNAVKKQMVNHEAVSPKKIHVINLGYNFELYHKPDLQKVKEIRELMNCKMILIVVSRMTASKRHIAAVQVLNNLIKKNLDVKMIMMDEGAEKTNIVAFLRNNHIEEKVVFTGFVNNTMNYMAAAHLLVHPSITEASNQVVKEAALLYKPAIVCKNVGDFDEYIINEKNGFIVDQSNLVSGMTEVIEKYYNKMEVLNSLGSKIHDTVLERFAIDPVCDQYLKLAK